MLLNKACAERAANDAALEKTKGFGRPPKPRVRQTTKPPDGGFVGVEGGPRPLQNKPSAGAVKALLIRVQRNRHERVLEIENEGINIFPLVSGRAQLGKINTVIYAAWQDLPFGQMNGAVHAVGPEVLD